MAAPLCFTVSDFIEAFGAPPGNEAVIGQEADKYDFTYRRLTAKQRGQVVQDIESKLDGFSQVGAHRKDIWENAWSDLSRRYEESGGDIGALDPPFMGATPTLRINGDYAEPKDSNFETHWFRVLRHWLFNTYLSDAKRVCEFGCGSGFNLVTLGEVFPDVELVGLDWSEAVVQLMNKVGSAHNLELSGHHFDFFNPDPGFEFGPGSAAMTFCALEQTGTEFNAFVDWLLERKPGLVLSMEPALEFYDPQNPFDDLAIRYHKKRKYLDGYYTRIQDLESDGRAEILKIRRLGFGSLYHEGYSLLIWRPLA